MSRSQRITRLRGQSPYSASKIGADQIAQSFFLSFETPVATIRPFNTYGPRQSARAVIPTIITQVASPGAGAIKLGSMHPTRDFNFVRDTGIVVLALRVAECDAAPGKVINIGSNFEISVGDTARLIADIMGREVEFTTDRQRLRPANSEVERLKADNSLARTLTGWKPEYGGLEGLRHGVEGNNRLVHPVVEPKPLQARQLQYLINMDSPDTVVERVRQSCWEPAACLCTSHR